MEKIIEFIIKSLIGGTIFTSILTIIAFLFREKLKALIQHSVKYAFDKKLEDYKTKELKRQKAVLIADLVSEWISFPADRKRLNQLTLEAFIWLPKETAHKLSDLLSHSPEALNVRELINDVRKLLLGDEESIDPKSIILFPPNAK